MLPEEHLFITLKEPCQFWEHSMRRVHSYSRIIESKYLFIWSFNNCTIWICKEVKSSEYYRTFS